MTRIRSKSSMEIGLVLPMTISATSSLMLLFITCPFFVESSMSFPVLAEFSILPVSSLYELASLVLARSFALSSELLELVECNKDRIFGPQSSNVNLWHFLCTRSGRI